MFKGKTAMITPRWAPDGKRKRRRPKETWHRMAESEMKEMGKIWKEIERIAQDS